jgi:hypothetical protein
LFAFELAINLPPYPTEKTVKQQLVRSVKGRRTSMAASAVMPSQSEPSQPQPTQPANWKSLYVAALLEANVERVPSLIETAERAIVVRARELFSAPGDNIQEEEALDDAMYALHALKNCIALHGRFAEAA